MLIKLRRQWTSSNSLQASATFTYVQYILTKRREEGERSGGKRASDVKVSFVRALLERWYCSRSHLRISRKHESSSTCINHSCSHARTLTVHCTFLVFFFFLHVQKFDLTLRLREYRRSLSLFVSLSFSRNSLRAPSLSVGKAASLTFREREPRNFCRWYRFRARA